MSRVIAAFAQFFNGDGTPLENGWLKFLNSNSNNSLKNTYADADQSIANANPLQLDADGRCPNVFGQGVYRIELYTNNPVTHLPGTLIQQFDPVYAEYLIEGAGGNFAEWDTDESYQVGSIVVYNGKYYRSFTSNNQGNMPDTATDEWEQIAFLRYWNADVTYLTDDVVISGSQLYFSLADANTGNVPLTSPAWWDPVGSGTTLLNWSESGTTFQPNATGYDLGSVTNIVGDAWINYLAQFTYTPSSLPTLDYHIANKIYVDETAALRMRWMSDWIPGTYEINDVVMDDNWTMVAVAQTTDRPAPQPAGDNLWVRDAFSPPAFSETSDSQPALFIGQRYEFTPAFTVRSIRIWLPATSIGDNVEVWMVYNSTTDPRIVNILPGFTITSNQVEKWVSLTIGSQYVTPGSFIDFIMVIRPGTGPLTFTYEWDYFRTNGDPSSGQIYHQGGLNVDQIRVHEEDSSATDRTSELNLIVPGSKITMDTQDYTWEVIQASKTGDVYTFIVDPAARAGAETSDFTFTYYSATPIYYVYNTDLYLSDSRISGYYATEYDPSNATYLNNNGYGIDIEVQNMISSDDWEVVAAPYGTVAGGSGSGLVYWEEADHIFRPVTSGDGQLGDATHLISGLYLGDSSTIYVGDGQDLSIVHDGTNSYILNGTGFLSIGTSAATSLYLTTNDTSHWEIDSAGELLPVTDSTYSIGSTSLRVLKLWADDIESTNVPTIAGGSFIDAAVPDQTGNAGEFLYTDGSNVSWSPVIVVTEQQNALYNPLMTIWQRGAGAFSTTDEYTADGVRLSFLNTSGSISQVAGNTINGYSDTEYGLSLTHTAGSATGDYCRLEKPIEDVRLYHDTTVTVNVVALIPVGNSLAVSALQNFGSGGSADVRTGSSANLAGTGALAVYTVTIDLPSISAKTIGTDNYLLAELWSDAGSDFDAYTNSLGHQTSGTSYIYAMQLRPGTRDSIIEIPNERKIKSDCLYFFWRMDLTVGRRACVMYANTGNITYGNIPLPNVMRTVRTLTPESLSNLGVQLGGSSYTPPTAFTAFQIDDSTNEIRLTFTAGTFPSEIGFGGAMYAAADTYIDFSCEF